MKVQHTVQVQVLMYYNTAVEDDTDHPMMDSEIQEIAKRRMLEHGPRSILFDRVFEGVDEDEIENVVVVSTESAETGEDMTDKFIDLQRKLKKGSRKQTPPKDSVLADFLAKL